MHARAAAEPSARAASRSAAEPGAATRARHSVPVVQRKIYVALDSDNIVTVAKDAERPPGPLPGGKQGDHTTPFTILQDQIGNAIELAKLPDAWVNLHNTYLHYQTLPGWATTRKGDKARYTAALDLLFATKGGLNELQTAVTWMLELRSLVDLTSLPKGGTGHGESKWAGSLMYQERQIQLKHGTTAKKNEVIVYMWKAFEHGRVNNLGDAKRNQILQQHALTVVDAYPLLSQELGITSGDVLAYYDKVSDWLAYQPAF